MAQSIEFLISVNETKTFEIAGGYIEVLKSSFPIDIIMFGTAGGISDEMRSVDSGTYATLDFKRVQVKSPGAQVVKLFIGEKTMGSRRQTGDVTISNKPAVSIPDAVTVNVANKPAVSIPDVVNVAIAGGAPLSVSVDNVPSFALLNDDETLKKTRIQQGQTFFFANIFQPGAAGVASCVGIKNNGAAGQKLAIKSLNIETNVLGDGTIYLLGAIPPGVTLGSTLGYVPRQYSAHQLINQGGYGSTFAGTGINSWNGATFTEFISKKDSREFKFDWPILLNPGECMMYRSTVAGANMAGTFIYEQFQ